MIDIKSIKKKISDGKYVVSFTHTEKLRARMILASDIEEAICNGEIIEPYPNDPRGASCLIFGYTNKRRPLHVVCGRLEQEELVIITAYEPNPDEWEDDLRTRKKGA